MTGQKKGPRYTCHSDPSRDVKGIQVLEAIVANTLKKH